MSMICDLHYLDQSAWLVQTPARRLLFDYGRIPRRPEHGSLAQGVFDFRRPDPLPLFAFASHSHADHYSASLQRHLGSRPDTWFIFGQDEQPSAAEQAAAPAGTWLIGPHSRLQLADLSIWTTASTDSGVSFLIDLPEALIYHGGDLAVWDDTDFYRRTYRQEIDRLAAWTASLNRVPDLAFLPVSTSDGYQEEAMLQGLWYFLDRLRPRAVAPMHAHGHEHFYRIFGDLAAARGWTNVLEPRNPGDSFTLA
jgi:L-ascorbate metabolism protein UlaG (beta-lactamase superfamily)